MSFFYLQLDLFKIKLVHVKCDSETIFLQRFFLNVSYFGSYDFFSIFLNFVFLTHRKVYRRVLPWFGHFERWTRGAGQERSSQLKWNVDWGE